MPAFSPHYCHGTQSTAFVLSVPGAAEAAAGRPVSGDTGANLDAALHLLHAEDPTNFPSTGRYEYRITNAFAKARAKSLGDSSSEARDAEVVEAQNVARVIEELNGCDLVVLCGRKAQLLAGKLGPYGKRVVKVAHPGNSGLNSTYPPVVASKGAVNPRQGRVALWAQDVLNSVRAIAGQDQAGAV